MYEGTNEGTYERRYVRAKVRTSEGTYEGTKVPSYLRTIYEGKKYEGSTFVPYFIRTNAGKNYRNAHTYLFA